MPDLYSVACRPQILICSIDTESEPAQYFYPAQDAHSFILVIHTIMYREDAEFNSGFNLLSTIFYPNGFVTFNGID